MSKLKSMQLSLANKMLRIIWQFVWFLLFRPSPIVFHDWRCFLLRLFGATIEVGAHPYPSAKIWAPWNLTMRKKSCLSHYVDCYSVDKIVLGVNSTVSQYSYLCTASHDYTIQSMPLITGPITIGDGAWVTADVFIGPGVSIGEGAIIGARSSVFRDVAPWTVVAGNPARFIKNRVMN
jgi:putative colanic acid biosynthesis acetyltransferase WcaF